MTSSRPPEIADQVPPDSPGAREIGFAIPQTYNASRILFDNLGKGRGDRLALTGPARARAAIPSFAPRPRDGATAFSRSG